MCPLCRAPACQVRQASELQVNAVHAALVRKAVGYSAYEIQRRETWAQAADLDAAGGLGGPLPLVVGQSDAWQRLRLGSQQEVMLGPRYEELLRRSKQSGDSCFAVLLQPADFEVGAKGRVCRIVNTDSPNSDGRVVVEAGAACRIIELLDSNAEAQGGSGDAEPLIIGKLEELAEEDLPAREVDLGPLAAASDIVNILGVLGRNLQAVRQRWMMTAMLELLDEDRRSLENAHTDRQGLESMLGVMMSYRQIIRQMDVLLSQASATADRLVPREQSSPDSASEPEEPDGLPDPVTTNSDDRSPQSAQALESNEGRPNGSSAAEELRRIRAEVQREPPAMSQAEALRRRGHVLPVAGAASILGATARAAPRSSVSTRRTRNVPVRSLHHLGVHHRDAGNQGIRRR